MKGRSHVEATLGEPLTLSCKVCTTRSQDVRVLWEKDGAPVLESPDLRSYRRHHGEFVLRVQRMEKEFLGNYSCLLVSGEVERGRRYLEASLLPPPPAWSPRGVSSDLETEFQLQWTGHSTLPIINYILEFRLKPVSGGGEDWISIIVPYEVNHLSVICIQSIFQGLIFELMSRYFQSETQSYTLRGLHGGTEYEARVRSRTRLGTSPHSSTLTFSTFSQYVVPTSFSLSREERKHAPLFSISSAPALQFLHFTLFIVTFLPSFLFHL